MVLSKLYSVSVSQNRYKKASLFFRREISIDVAIEQKEAQISLRKSET